MPKKLSAGESGLLVHPLSYVRHERNWSLQDVANIVARRLNTAARREKAWRWERWGVVPDAGTQLALAAELGVPADRVRLLGWPNWLPAGDGIDIDVPWTAASGVMLLDGAAGKAVLDRRGFLILAAGAATSIAKQWLDFDPPQITHALNGGHVDTGLVDVMESRLPGLRSMEYALGGGSVRTIVDAELVLVTDLLKGGNYSDAVGARLFAIAAELGRVADWASFDTGYHASAERYWIAALHAAHGSGDRALGANILKCMSLQRVDTGRAGEALELAQAALNGAKLAPARVRAMLSARQARAHAVLGDVVGCQRLLAAAERAMARADAEPSPPWSSYFDEPEFCAQVAACHLLLSRHREAEDWLVRSLALQPKERRRDRATYLIWQADAAHHLGDVERACHLVGRAVPDVIGAPSARNRRRLIDINAQLRTHDVAATTVLNEQIRDAIAA